MNKSFSQMPVMTSKQAETQIKPIIAMQSHTITKKVALANNQREKNVTKEKMLNPTIQHTAVDPDLKQTLDEFFSGTPPH